MVYKVIPSGTEKEFANSEGIFKKVYRKIHESEPLNPQTRIKKSAEIRRSAEQTHACYIEIEA